MVKAGFKWMFLILGTMIGAGYASGRELWQFFGQESALAIILFTTLIIISTLVVMTISYNHKTIHYMPALEALLGKRFSGLYDGMIILYLFSTTVIMLAGGGASLVVIGLPNWLGISFISTCLILLFIWGNKGMVSMSTVVIPILIVLLVGVLVKFIQTTENVMAVNWLRQSNWPSAFTFTALNILPLVAVISAVGRDIKGKGEIWIASIGSGLILGAISFLYNQSLLKITHEIILYEIPLFGLLKAYPHAMTIIMSALLWFAIYTTAASGIFGLVTRFRHVLRLPLWCLSLIAVILMLPLTTLGFSKLIGILYPIYGFLNLYLLAAILIYPIMHRFD
ncbi:putative membrane protein YkvI [Scopulibacillus darangshiensis]|uniref:Putative membrane protein YkvI n=1 Tax=Scopulibacillus darangshiensis TaxID=442528 RepID=A0A4R2NFE9_9BACL|nr:hypothetical protein [Scopulibacillus darangshiensis]TCP20021.1 putative membrane protein YkvI [Scopulibacillus darangshiensis]